MALGLRPVGSMVKREREAVRTTAMSAERASTKAEQETGAGEGESGGAIADVDGADALAIVDGVDGDVLGVKVGHVEQGIVAGDEAADGSFSDHVSAADVVGASDDLGDGVGEGVQDEELAAVGLEGQLHGGVADVHESFEAIGLARRGGLGGVAWGGQGDDHDLVAGGAGYKGFGGVGQDDGVRGAGQSSKTARHDGAAGSMMLTLPLRRLATSQFFASGEMRAETGSSPAPMTGNLAAGVEVEDGDGVGASESAVIGRAPEGSRSMETGWRRTGMVAATVLFSALMTETEP